MKAYDKEKIIHMHDLKQNHDEFLYNEYIIKPLDFISGY